MYKNNYDINYFENEYFKITIYNNKFKDLFNINILDDFIFIKRVDDNIGWGQDLKLQILNKVDQKKEILTIGPSEDNIKKIGFNSIIINTEKYHYENSNYKIFYISKEYDDIFKINYDEISKILIVERIDSKEGWGQKLNLKYFEKNTKREKIIYIGKSKYEKININIDIDKINYKSLINYYESINFKITLFENKNPDLFDIFFYEDNNTIYIKRIDSNEGWGQLLMINLFDVIQNYNFIIYIGSSTKNEVYKKVDLTIRKTYIALTTIPSRTKLPIFIENIKDIINNQSNEIEGIFITIPENYKRFKESISEETIDYLRKLPKVIVNKIDNDYGPASKYLGPLINYYKEVKNNILIVIDDDRKYNKNLVRNFNIAYNSFPNITFSSGLWKEYFNKNYNKMDDNYLDIQTYKEENNNTFYYGQGLGGFFGFAILVRNIEKFINYNLWILNRIPKSFFHDEGIILGYLKYKEENILYLKHYGCNYIKEELVDALCTSRLVDRGKVEREILQISNLEKI